MDSPAAVIQIRDLHKAFGDRVVLSGVDLHVGKAENVVVLGRSGSGKSVLIKIVVGLLAADRGTVDVLGQRVGALKPKELDALRRRIGFSFQHSALYDSMDVGANLAFPLTMNVPGLTRADVDARVDAALDAVGLLDFRRQMPSELSGGQRKRVGVARALILEPEIMLYDEPTAGLDPLTSGELNELIRQVQATRHTSAILITHDLTCARDTGDRVSMLVEGKMIGGGSFDDLFAIDDPRVRAFYDYNFTKRDA